MAHANGKTSFRRRASSFVEVLAMAHANCKTAFKRRVTWADVKGASFEMQEYEPSPDLSVPLPDTSGRVAGATGCFSKIGAMCSNLLSEILGGRGEPADEIHGYLWKLGQEAGETLNAMQDIRNWRRRLFFLHEGKGQVNLTYISEKGNGHLHVACHIRGKKLPTPTISHKEEIPMHLTEDAKQWVVRQSSQYDIAYDGDTCHHGEETYTNELPEKLWPFRVLWKDAQGTEHHMLLAAVHPDLRSSWVKCIEKYAL